VGVTYQGYIADAARTFVVKTIPEHARRLIKTTKDALRKGISAAQKGNRISDISRAIQNSVEGEGFSVVRELTGHGVGKGLHEEPMIPNFVCSGPDPVIETGMVIAIEPMVNEGGHEVITEENGWTISARDGSLSCHFEDTIAILARGNMNLTRVMGS
jgi:methionyl aminopeptidase